MLLRGDKRNAGGGSENGDVRVRSAPEALPAVIHPVPAGLLWLTLLLAGGRCAVTSARRFTHTERRCPALRRVRGCDPTEPRCALCSSKRSRPSALSGGLVGLVTCAGVPD